MDPGPNGVIWWEHLSKEENDMSQRNYQEVKQELEGHMVRVITYQIGSQHHCHVEIVDPGAVIARGSGDSLEKAKATALSKAVSRLKK